MKKKLTLSEAEALIEKYYDGYTNVAEEKQLLAFLSRRKLPPQFEPDRAILSYFSNKKTAPKQQVPFIQYIRLTGIAATLALALFCSKALFSGSEKTNFAYIDGKKVTDVNIVKTQALASLQVMVDAPNEVEESIKNLNNREIIEQQLSAFAQIQ